VAEGKSVNLDKVLLIGDDKNVTVGTPTVDGAKVKATSKGEGRGDKVIVFKYKPKVRYRKKTGHRQFYTRLLIDEIVGPGVAKEAKAKAPKKAPKKAAKKEVTEDGS
jgi:large subunit ribosomal protein L21